MRSAAVRPSPSFEKVCEQALRNAGKVSPAAQDRIREATTNFSATVAAISWTAARTATSCTAEPVTTR